MRLFILLLLAACASPRVYDHPDLVDQILVPRKGHPGLTTGRCAEYKSKGFMKGYECSRFEVIDYDLADANIREQLRSFHFLCKVGDERYLICKDQPGLCSMTYEYKRFLGIKVKKIPKPSYIDQSETDKLLNANTYCFNEERYDPTAF